MKLSIVTVSYNAAETIETTIRSVVRQESPWTVEYIVIDGDSTDGTLNVLETYESEIDVLVSRPDDGIYDAMNRGIRRASGDWIGILNSDDWYAEHAFNSLRRTIQKHQASDVVVGGVMRVSGDEESGKYVAPPIERFGTIQPNNHPATFVRRRVYENVGGYDLRYPISADVEFILRVQETSANLTKVDELLTYMREGGASSGLTGIAESYEIEKKYADGRSALRVVVRKLWQKGRRRLLQSILLDRDVELFRKQWWTARRDHRALTSKDFWAAPGHSTE